MLVPAGDDCDVLLLDVARRGVMLLLGEMALQCATVSFLHLVSARTEGLKFLQEALMHEPSTRAGLIQMLHVASLAWRRDGL
jgi:hypothetical protein